MRGSLCPTVGYYRSEFHAQSIGGLKIHHQKKLGYSHDKQCRGPEILSKQPEKFDLIISDQTTPEITGDELARRLLELKPYLPIILCTGFSSKIDKQKAAALGVRAFVMKPFDKEELACTIRQVLDGKTKSAQ